MKVQKITGYRGLNAVYAFHALMLGLKMLPAYGLEQYEDFLDRVYKMPKEDQHKIIKEAAIFVELPKEHVQAMSSFCLDPNGVPYSKEQFDDLDPKLIVEIITSVAMEIADFKIGLVTEDEKKK